MSGTDADRNLLLGIIAQQENLIGRDDLIAALLAWAEAPGKTLGEILVERGCLDPDARSLLETRVDDHIRRHQGNPTLSLAAIGPVDPMVTASIDGLATRTQAAADPATTADFDGSTAPGSDVRAGSGSRYRKVRGHAKGGLGIVFVAHDEELSREVALKEIQDRHADDPDKRARFLIEAEVTGGLEHPGIVPVYGLGRYDDGRPFYAMRFIRGDSLKDAIAGFHESHARGDDPGARTLSLQKLLRRFLDVCNAIAYAHSRGVLHRDLKPDNVMVGQYGETLVVDWGLAKALGRSNEGPSPAPPPISPTSTDVDDTLPGSILGTPAYMSPEQAAGRLDLLGPASDVYSLGATLYTLLTGRVAFPSRDVVQVLRQVQSGEFASPRSVAPWLDPALDAVTLKAMATRPADRYPDPKALAEDIERWLADEPVTAHREPWTRRAARWSRKHRTALTAALAASVVALAAGCVYAWTAIDRVRRADSSGLATDDHAARLGDDARRAGDPALWTIAIAEGRRAEAQLDSGGGSPGAKARVKARLLQFEAELQSVERDRKLVAELEEARILGSNIKDGREDIISKIVAMVAALRSYGIGLTIDTKGPDVARLRASRIAPELFAALDEINLNIDPATRRHLADLLAASDDDRRRAEVRDRIARADYPGLRRIVAEESRGAGLGLTARVIFSALSANDSNNSLAALEAIHREHPSDFWLNFRLGVAHVKAVPPRPEKALRYYQAAVALRPDSPALLQSYGYALSEVGEPEEAKAAYRKAIRIAPDYSAPYNNLGSILHEQGDEPGALAAYREADRLMPNTALIRSNLASGLYTNGDVAGAIALWREVIRLDPKLPEAHRNLSRALREQKDYDGAIAAAREAIRLRPDFSMALEGLGLALKEKGDLPGAINALREARRADPKNPDICQSLGQTLLTSGDVDGAVAELRPLASLRPELHGVHHLLGRAFEAKGDAAGALGEFREAVRLKPEFAPSRFLLGSALLKVNDPIAALAEFREAVRLDPNFGLPHNGIAAILLARKDFDGAIREAREAIRLDPVTVEFRKSLAVALTAKGDRDGAIDARREVVRLQPAEANNHLFLADLLREKGLDDEALAEYREAARLDPKLVPAINYVGMILGLRGDSRGAADAFRKVVELRPELAQGWNNLGSALKNLEDFDGAVKAYREAVRIDPGLVPAWYDLASSLGRKGDLDEAINACRETIRRDADHAEAHCDLGHFLQRQGQFAQAVAPLERGHALGSRRPDWRNDSARWVRDARRMADLSAKLPAVLKGEVKLSDADDLLAMADLCAKTSLNAASTRFFSEAFAARPALLDATDPQHRYNAACVAALAGSGRGKDDPLPDDAVRVAFRGQARAWLLAELAAWSRRLEANPGVVGPRLVPTLAHWIVDADLAGIRDPEPLAKLPEPERAGCLALWADVEALRARAVGGK